MHAMDAQTNRHEDGRHYTIENGRPCAARMIRGRGAKDYGASSSVGLGCEWGVIASTNGSMDIAANIGGGC
jgi:hypothetical protein